MATTMGKEKPGGRRLTEQAMARVKAPLQRAWTLPPEAYTAADVFEAEIRQIFRRDWICVARVDQIPQPGDYRCVELVDQPIVVARARDGMIHAFSRICLHRAMPVAEGCGNATRFVCPYHNWTYELDGRLRSAPMMEGAEEFEPSGCRLPALAVEVWQGFVFVNADPDCSPLAPRLEGLARHLEGYGFDELVVAETLTFDSPWNWKILVENFMEAYHHIGTHRQTFEPVYPARASRVEPNSGEPWSLLRMPGHPHEDELPPLPGLSSQQRCELLAMCVFPTLLFAASASMAAWYELSPTAHDAMTLRIHVLLRCEVAAMLDDDARAAVAEGVRAIHTEDIAANQGPWRGLAAPMTAQGRLSPYEAGIWQLNQLWAQRMKF